MFCDPTNKMKISLEGIKIGQKGVWSSFLNDFLENIQSEDFGFKILEKGHI